MYRPLSVLLVILVGLSVPLPAGAPFRKGLAQQTTEVRLNRKRPPKVYLLGTSIRVEGATQACLIPEYPAIKLLKNISGELPIGETVPKPVITTRLVMLNQTLRCLLSYNFIHQVNNITKRFYFKIPIWNTDFKFVLD